MSRIHYVVVVHGIGAQKKNETAISVVSRFAEARRPPDGRGPRDVLTLGMASSQTGWDRKASNPSSPWMEFRGLPSSPLPQDHAEIRRPFLGERDRTGDNVRFMDVCWADLMQEDYREVGQGIGPWTEGVIGRLERRDEYASKEGRPGGRVPRWILENLRTIRDTAEVIDFYLKVRGMALRETLFDEYLGDVQLYGEYAQTRGRSVLRFHQLMARLEEQHEADHKGTEARYTIIAHSLGTVMAMDALLYAHATAAARLKPIPGLSNVPFEGYIEELKRQRKDGELPDKPIEQLLETPWIDRVDSFVTLGSPIDKYLVVWWLNYKYLLRPADWMDCQASWAAVDETGRPCPKGACPGRHRSIERRTRIAHYNYCEEQDPVGHELDVARSAPAFQAAFHTWRDQVYNRDPLPLAAHVSYWKDQDLQRFILHQAVDCEVARASRRGCPDCRGLEPEWFNRLVYSRIQWISYLAIPVVVLLLDFIAFLAAYYSENTIAALSAAIVFVPICWVGRKLLDLSIWWRQIQVAKSAAKWGE